MRERGSLGKELAGGSPDDFCRKPTEAAKKVFLYIGMRFLRKWPSISSQAARLLEDQPRSSPRWGRVVRVCVRVCVRVVRVCVVCLCVVCRCRSPWQSVRLMICLPGPAGESGDALRGVPRLAVCGPRARECLPYGLGAAPVGEFESLQAVERVSEVTRASRRRRV